jgi:hypothetical protein
MAAGVPDSEALHIWRRRMARESFYNVNANSNLRAPIGQAFGFDPFERVVDYLSEQIERAGVERTAVGSR